MNSRLLKIQRQVVSEMIEVTWPATGGSQADAHHCRLPADNVCSNRSVQGFGSSGNSPPPPSRYEQLQDSMEFGDCEIGSPQGATSRFLADLDEGGPCDAH
jgi:hypothetical protein